MNASMFVDEMVLGIAGKREHNDHSGGDCTGKTHYRSAFSLPHCVHVRVLVIISAGRMLYRTNVPLADWIRHSMNTALIVIVKPFH